MAQPDPAAQILQLRVDAPADDPDRPVVTILVDGLDVFGRLAPGWHGFDPIPVFTDPSPLLPARPRRRVALYRCSCGVPGCGVIAPLVVAEDSRVRWLDFRDFVGVFDGPVVDEEPAGGTRWKIGSIAFDRRQYEAEVRRAAADRSWETPRRATARILHRLLGDSASRLAAGGLELGWTSPRWGGEPGYCLCLWRVGRPRDGRGQVLLHLRPDQRLTPSAQARAMLAELFATDPEEWPGRHGRRR